MSLEFQFTCPLPNGIHARPASALEEVASCFGANISLTNRRTGRTANLKSVLAIVGADIRQHDACHLNVVGPDELDAMAALRNFLEHDFPRCDDALPQPLPTNGERRLPPMLQKAGADIRPGTPMVKGIGIGRIVHAAGLRIPDTIPMTGATDFAAEVRKLDTAVASLVASYEERLPNSASRVEADLLKAHRAVARDPEFRAQLHENLRREARTAAGAIADTEAHFANILLNSESALLRERALDLRDVCLQLLRQIYGKSVVAMEVSLVENSIVVAEMLTPGQFLGLDRRFLRGLVLGHAGTTSHTVILARSFGIPTLVGVTGLAGAQLNGLEAVVDAECGLLGTNLTESAQRYYAMEQKRLADRRARQQHFASDLARCSDGKRIEIAGNISTAAEAAPAFESGAEGIGLFRTEMLFLDRDEPPTEAEQFQDYCAALTAAGERPVTLRTLDIGGDKPLAYLNLPTEDNPFLGYRAVRIYPEFESIFRTQIRAMVRASAHGKLQLMIPMVTTLDEIRWAKRIIAEEQRRCEAERIDFDRNMPVGVMIEVPAAAFVLDQLCTEVDFFSIGSNDLLQYFAGADRANPRVAKLYDPIQPAFLRFLHKAVTDVHAGGRKISICGEMAGQVRYLALLVGLGLDAISVTSATIATLKAELSRWTVATCRELFHRAAACATADEVRLLLDEYVAQLPAPLVTEEMVIIESSSQTKEEVIKEIADRLYVLGRTEQPHAVEAAIWERESIYSTGFGHGFAVPHCKTNAVSANSLVLLKLRQPVAWNSLDGQPVNVVMMLVMREADKANGHMRIFSELARRVMHDDFRDNLIEEPRPDKICVLLNEGLKKAAS